MSRADSLPRAVGLTVAVTAPLAAAAALGLAVLARLSRRPARVVAPARRRISDVPARPPLWDAHPATGPILAVPDLRDIAPVPPENNHAPATPPRGIALR